MEKNIKSHSDEIDIPKEDPFVNSAFKEEDEKYAEILTNIVSVYSKSGCVLALNGEWGSGKTTFVKMWKQQLEKGKFKTLYFNAWESDYTTDPLIAMLSEFESLSSKDGNYKKLISAGGRIALSVGVDIAKGIIKKATGVDPNKIQATIKETSDIGTEYLKEYAEQKSSFKEFKESLKEFVGSNANDDKPIVFFVDELDRCNPTYAVKVLERIKHLFDIPQIVFVLAVNKKQLGYAIQGYFGSSKMNADAYLRRFIDIEYTLPEPDMWKYCSHLYDIYGFKDFFENSDRKNYNLEPQEIDTFLQIASTIANGNHVSLRTVDKVFAISRLVLMECSKGAYLFSGVFFLLCYWKIVDFEFYDNIKKHRYDIKELLSEIENRFSHNILDGTSRENNIYSNSLIWAIGLLICQYDATGNGQKYENGSSVSIFPIDCKIIDKKNLNMAINYYSKNHHYNKSLKNTFGRIDLLDNFSLN